MVFAIRKQNEHLVVVALFKGVQGRPDRLGHRGAAFGDRVDIQRLNALPEGRVIHGERTLQECVPRESHQTHAVGLRLLHQVERGQLGARQAAGRDVLGEHAFRRVDGDHDVETALLDLLEVIAPLGLCEGENQGGHRQNQARLPDPLPRG